MRVPCIPLHEISMFGIMFISVFCSIGAIRLYLFDSPAALKNIFHRMKTIEQMKEKNKKREGYLTRGGAKQVAKLVMSCSPVQWAPGSGQWNSSQWAAVDS